MIMLSVGIITALIACCIDITIDVLARYKYGALREWTDYCVQEQYNCLYIPYLMWVALNVAPAVMGSFLIAYLEPVAMGSGIPQVKCYLNGVKVDERELASYVIFSTGNLVTVKKMQFVDLTSEGLMRSNQ